MLKRCKKCKLDLDVSLFYTKKASKDGLQSFCKKCAVERAKKHYRKYKEEFSLRAKNTRLSYQHAINKIKVDYGCFNCGNKIDVCLDFHHLDPKEKDFSVSQLTLNKTLQVVPEINKCLVACSNCHRMIHAKKLKVDKTKVCKITESEFTIVLNEFGIGKEIKRTRRN